MGGNNFKTKLWDNKREKKLLNLASSTVSRTFSIFTLKLFKLCLFNFLWVFTIASSHFIFPIYTSSWFKHPFAFNFLANLLFASFNKIESSSLEILFIRVIGGTDGVFLGLIGDLCWTGTFCLCKLVISPNG